MDPSSPAPVPPCRPARRPVIPLIVAALVLAGLAVGPTQWAAGWMPSTGPSDRPSIAGVALMADTGELDLDALDADPPDRVGSDQGRSEEPVSSARVAEVVAPAVMNINTVIGKGRATAAGTGIVLTSSGQVLTNNHVINGATSIRATNAANGRTYQASVVGRDRNDDIAVLQLSGASALRTAKIGDSDAVAVGDQIAAVGNADGANVRPSVATGKVTALGRSISAHDELTGRVERLSGLIEVDANVRPGDSGGPLVNTAGEVVGVDTAASGNFRVQAEGGTGYAIPINSALTIARRIASGGGSGVPRIRPAAILDLGVLAPLTPLGPAVEPPSAGAGQPWAASVQLPVRTVSFVSTQPPGRRCATVGAG
ncbi:MAG TPA: trypsin-like peptidase domain-containing protein [Pseudonocardia sp.]|jgi:S1-C subfamily serine protease|uniref:S1C family serine protease n=1 Tax=Pseudonocardia sp. TaxID=60912 RepID=UPI002EDB0170